MNNVSGQLTKFVADIKKQKTKEKQMKHLVSSQIRDREGSERKSL